MEGRLDAVVGELGGARREVEVCCLFASVGGRDDYNRERAVEGFEESTSKRAEREESGRGLEGQAPLVLFRRPCLWHESMELAAIRTSE